MFSWANLAKYLRYCRTYGLLNATRLAFRKIRRGRQFTTFLEPLFVDVYPESGDDSPIELIRKKISIIIPTRDAGPDFGLLLRKLKSQKGIEQIQIVLVDSGSTDDTVKLATSENADVISIAPDSFSHSYARNCGAARTTGDYLLFLVQDAVPLTDVWLWEMARALESNEVVGVSCAEYPRADCDLFYRFVIWNHYRSLQLDRDRILQWDSSCTSMTGLRANAQISGISFLVRRDVFQQYWYSGDYAEDLQLGIRLIQDGYKVGFLYSTRVLHSHTRPASYFLKRGYVDTRYLAKILPEYNFPTLRDTKHVFGSICSLYQRLVSMKILLDQCSPVATAEFMAGLHRQIVAPAIPQREAVVDEMFDDFVHSLCGRGTAKYDAASNMIVPHLLQHLITLKEFLSRAYPQVDESLSSEIRNCLVKMFALHAGTHLAYLYLGQGDVQNDPSLLELDRKLVKDV